MRSVRSYKCLNQMKHGLMISRRDGLDALLSLAGTVDAVITDPPSGKTQAWFDKKPNLELFWAAVWTALKPGGVAVVMASSFDFAAELREKARARICYDLVWFKSAASGFLNARRRELRAHEFVLVCSRGQPTYNPQLVGGHEPIRPNRAKMKPSAAPRGGANYGKAKGTPSRIGKTDRFPISVLCFPCVGTSSKDRVHPQQKPSELAQYLVRTYSNPGDLVVDPFAGSGVFVRTALEEGRRGLGFDAYWPKDPREA